MNAAGDPIAGAIVEVMLTNRVREMSRRPVPSIWLAEVPGPGKNPCVTDADGRWSLNNVPEGVNVHVGLKLTHSEYTSDTRWGGLQQQQAISMTSLRDQSATIRMHRGIIVTGTVVDPALKPISDAVVVSGNDPYGQEGSQEVRTNADGVYQLPPLAPGPTSVTVIAPGWSPESKIVDVISDIAYGDFRLRERKVLRIRFVDGAGNAVPNVGVGIRSWRGKNSL